MIKRITMFVATALLALSLAAPAAFAAPITCPGSQEAEKTSEGWVCVNPAENETGAEKPKNPNATKFKF